VINQIEGGIIQTVSWTLKERVDFDRHGVTTRTWDDYPILTFKEAPEVEVALINRPEAPPVGAGEGTQGPVSAAIGNAIYNALGARFARHAVHPRPYRCGAERIDCSSPTGVRADEGIGDPRRRPQHARQGATGSIWPLTLAQYEEHIRGYAKELDIDVSFFHSNIEGEVCNALYAAFDSDIDGCVINPAGYTTVTGPLRAAIAQMKFPWSRCT